MQSEIPVLFVLDLASEYLVPVSSIESMIPHGDGRVRVWRATEFGAERSGTGSDPDLWQSWSRAIKRMWAHASCELGEDIGRAHLYVAGYAGLPAFIYLGIKLLKHERITVFNPRPGVGWQAYPLCGGSPAADEPRYFEKIDGLPDQPSMRRGKVAVFVSAGYAMNREEIERYADSQDVTLAGIVEFNARQVLDPTQTIKWITPVNAATGARELRGLASGIRESYPNHEGLILCVAGPVQLALMAGCAFNPRVYSPLWIPNFDSETRRYQPAIEMPWPVVRGGKLKVLIATASPADRRSLDTERELRVLLQTIRESMKDRVEVIVRPAATIDDVVNALMAEQPHIFQFSGHSDDNGIYLSGEGGSGFAVPAAKLRDALSLAGDSLHLIILNSCHSSHHAAWLGELADCIIGTNCALSDRAALKFSGQFYRALGMGKSVEDAMKSARVVLEADGDKTFTQHEREPGIAGRLILYAPRPER